MKYLLLTIFLFLGCFPYGTTDLNTWCDCQEAVEHYKTQNGYPDEEITFYTLDGYRVDQIYYWNSSIFTFVDSNLGDCCYVDSTDLIYGF